MMTTNIKDTIYSLLPTPIYKYLSNQYHQFLTFSYSICNHENYDIENIYVAGFIGIIFGLLLVTFLEFFPGEPFSYELEKDNTTDINNKNDCDIVSKSKIEHLRKKFDLTEDEIIKFMNKKEQGDEDFIKQKLISSQQCSTSTDIEDDLELTLTQKLNLLIYGSLFIGLIYVLNKDYDSVVTLWFVRMFPKEASTLGFNIGN